MLFLLKHQVTVSIVSIGGMLTNTKAYLVMTVLGVPASSAPVVRLFSIAGDIITDDRNRLDADLASKLIFLRATWGPLEEYIRQLEEKRKTTR